MELLPKWKRNAYLAMIAVCVVMVVFCIIIKRTDALVLAALLTAWCVGLLLHAIKKAKQ